MKTFMLDGFICGLVADAKTRELMTRKGCKRGEEYYIKIRGKSSSLLLSLRKGRYDDLYYLNLSGNPTTFLLPNNLRGYISIDRLILKCFNRALAYAGLRSVKLEKINVYSIELACYTTKVADVDVLLDQLKHVYRTAYSYEGTKHVGLCNSLRLKLIDHPTHSSVCLRIMSQGLKEEEAMLMAYNKQEESGHDDIELSSRIRLDLNLSYGWFRRRQAGGRKLKTLADLKAYASMGWAAFIRAQFEWAANRTRLFELANSSDLAIKWVVKTLDTTDEQRSKYMVDGRAFACVSEIEEFQLELEI